MIAAKNRLNLSVDSRAYALLTYLQKNRCVFETFIQVIVADMKNIENCL